MNAETPVGDPLEAFLRSKSKGGEGSGNYRRNLERCVEDFLEWLEADAQSGTTFDELDERTFRRYARDLTARDLAPGTIRTYYAQVSAYIGWCVREGLLEANYAQRNVAKEPLPENDGRRSGDQQAWTDEHRLLITRHVDERAHDAADEKGFGAIREFRDRALVYVLCYSGVRGGEIFADPKDDRRNGLRWGDVSLDDQKMTVLAKKQDWSDRSLTKQAVNPMRRYKRLLDPASDEWPVFPTFHLPSLYETLRTGLRDEYDWSTDEIEPFVDELTGQTEVFDALRERDLSPPSINTDGARRIMRRLCADADLELEGKHDYLAPHGGRRGAGEVMVRQRGFTAAARLLDNSEEVVRKSYSHIEAKEMAEDAGAAFTEHDT
ncbi:phage integrase SAM-like domain-containing protein [Haloterrigena sp. SYSU A121-1]|uniref:Phage integrase SAM-like domain-containing protein n=1 Tax=Haloterrigena gelatinilytica TaxID=2741724 RepID=A0A8J8GPQ5_9EURY|nr:phage integrase SAM-like domain-containing protein [Haloterrigena gelatinilytica]NUB93706.1 phage integrase SAM-like domain-containing protein [Haloterrigena gelatinilytica]